MLGVLPFVEDPDLSVSAACALAPNLPPWFNTDAKHDRCNVVHFLDMIFMILSCISLLKQYFVNLIASTDEFSRPR